MGDRRDPSRPRRHRVPAAGGHLTTRTAPGPRRRGCRCIGSTCCSGPGCVARSPWRWRCHFRRRPAARAAPGDHLRRGVVHPARPGHDGGPAGPPLGRVVGDAGVAGAGRTVSADGVVNAGGIALAAPSRRRPPSGDDRPPRRIASISSRYGRPIGMRSSHSMYSRSLRPISPERPAGVAAEVQHAARWVARRSAGGAGAVGRPHRCVVATAGRRTAARPVARDGLRRSRGGRRRR